MISFDKLWGAMEKRGISSYILREKHNIDSQTIRRLKANRNVTTDTLNKICSILKCGLEEIAEYVPDKTYF